MKQIKAFHIRFFFKKQWELKKEI